MVNPFQSMIALSFVALFLSFFATSSNKAIRKYLLAVVLFFMLAAFSLNIHSYVLFDSFSDSLIIFGGAQVIEIGIIIFSAINVLFFIFIRDGQEDYFVKELLLFVFLVISAQFIIISKNFLMMFISLSVLIITMFQLVSIANSKVDKIVNYTMRFFLRPTLTIILFFTGYSLLYGASDFKEFSQVLESEQISSPIILLALIIFGVAIYLYFFLFPAQGPYMEIAKRNSHSANALIWFLYFPAGIFLFLKTSGLYSYFLERNNVYGSVILITLTCGCMLASNIGAISTKSPRRIISFIFLFFVSTFLFNMSMYSTGIITGDQMNLFNFINIFIMLFSFMPLQFVFSSIEDNTGEDSIMNIRGLGRNYVYAGANMVILFLSWLGLIYYLEPFINLFKKLGFLNAGVINIVLLVVFIICFIFLSVNIFRIIVNIFKEATGETRKLLFSKFLYTYVTFYSLVIISVPVIILIDKLGVNVTFMDFGITEFVF